MRKVIYLLCLQLLLLSLVSAVSAEQPVEKAQRVSDSVMSPFCPGRTLSACPSSEARDLRLQIERWFEQGYTEQGVMSQLEMLYSADIKGLPQGGKRVWLYPGLIVLALFALVCLRLKTLKSREPLPLKESIPEAGMKAVDLEVKRRLGA